MQRNRGECYVKIHTKTEAQIGVPGKEASEAGRGEEGCSPRAFGGSMITDTLSLDFWQPKSSENKCLLF